MSYLGQKLFTGATAVVNGIKGLVPAPLAGDQNKFLSAAGGWVRPTPAVLTVVSNSTITPTSDFDMVDVTVLATAANVANPTGTYVNGQTFVVRIRDNGTIRALTWGTVYRPVGTLLPNTTVASKLLYVYCIWNANDSKFDVTGAAQEV